MSTTASPRAMGVTWKLRAIAAAWTAAIAMLFIFSVQSFPPGDLNPLFLRIATGTVGGVFGAIGGGFVLPYFLARRLTSPTRQSLFVFMGGCAAFVVSALLCIVTLRLFAGIFSDAGFFASAISVLEVIPIVTAFAILLSPIGGCAALLLKLLMSMTARMAS